MKKILDVNYYNDLSLDIYLPDNKGFKTIVYFHGGGISSGHRNDNNYVDIGVDFANHGYAFVSVDYHLYPNTKFPEFLKEDARAVKYVFDHIKELGGNGDIYISGQSAGAWMAMMLCVDKHYLLDVGVDPLLVKGWISDSAQMTSHFNILTIEDKLNPLTQRIDEKAPLYFLNENFNSSPILIIFYEFDMPNRPEQNQLFYSAVKNFKSDIDIEKIKLPGGHCQGSSKKDDDNRFPYTKVAIEWLERH